MTSMTRQRIRYSVILLTTISLMAFAVYAMAAGEKSQVLRGLTLHANGATVTVDPGECLINGKVVKVTKPTTLQIDPADTIDVKDEAVKLSATAPASYNKGTRLRGPNAHDVNALGSLVLDSVSIHTKDGVALTKDQDFLVSADHAMLGIGPNSKVTTQDTVSVSYKYSQMRIDAVEIGAAGDIVLRRGVANITVPLPPAPTNGYVRIANIFRPYGATTVSDTDIYPITETAAEAQTMTTSGRIPKTLAKLRAGGEVTIVCWGDSVTAGGNASVPEKRYVDVFAAGLRQRFPNAKINVINISVGGSNSGQWLYPDKNPPAPGQKGIDFQRIIDAHPDLVTMEFVNDVWKSPEDLQSSYSDVLKRCADMHAEAIFITPHFTNPKWMGFKTMRDQENRRYVKVLCDFANAHNVAIADASSRWAHLWKEGIPYLTMLDNSVNHPDDRGHQLFADELWKCFAN